MTRLSRMHRVLAARGIVAARVDVRGSGSSGGTATDEYSEDELRDGVDVIAWLAAQPWSNGRVGMFGSSYGGFNSLQVAMRRPPALKAICPMYFTDNRYTDDCHYKGGSMQMLFDVATYGLSMVSMNSLPPARPRRATTGRRSGRTTSRPSRGCSTGSSTRPTTTTGSMARCARTMARSGRDLSDRRLARRLHELQPADLSSTCDARRS